ncbi:MAG: hypothetical protein IPJ34_40920 [Myxococcales bacterium]|nr:hypothetical protein [Myxococcales bacterium]
MLPLDQVYGQVRQLLAMSTDLDAYVALRVETVGGTVVSRRNQRAALLVRRYDAWFDRNVEHLEDGVRIRPDATALERLGTDTLADLRVDARRIGDVEGVVHALAKR